MFALHLGALYSDLEHLIDLARAVSNRLRGDVDGDESEQTALLLLTEPLNSGRAWSEVKRRGWWRVVSRWKTE